MAVKEEKTEKEKSGEADPVFWEQRRMFSVPCLAL